MPDGFRIPDNIKDITVATGFLSGQEPRWSGTDFDPYYPGAGLYTRRLVVDVGGKGDYTSIKSACDYVATQTHNGNNRWVIVIGNGNYVELPFTIPTFTALVGEVSPVWTSAPCVRIFNSGAITSGAFITANQVTAMTNIEISLDSFGTIVADVDAIYAPSGFFYGSGLFVNTSTFYSNATAFYLNLIRGASIFLSNCVLFTHSTAAYRAKGAASLAASYINLNNPGTFDAAPGVAPTFNPLTGWGLDGATQFLLTGFPGGPKPVTIICRLVCNDFAANWRAVRSAATNLLEFQIVRTTGKYALIKQNVVQIGASASSLTTGVDTIIAATYDASGNFAFYLNGSPDGSGTNDQTFSGVTTGRIGNQVVGTGEWFLGTIAAYAEYNVAKSPAAVAAIVTAISAF